MYQSATLVPKQENVSRKYFTNKKFQKEQREHKENIFLSFFPPQEDISAFLGQRLTIPSLGLCAHTFFFFLTIIQIIS